MASRPRLKKRLGQHHLTRSEVCRPLVEFLEPEGRRVVEIGPGGGVLTHALAAAGARVLALEIDPEWAFHLRRERGAEVPVAVLDALELDYSRLPAPTLVAGNLPYNVGTPILTAVLEHGDRVPRAGFLLQLEVARRLVAEPGSRAYGSLSVWTRFCSRPRILARVPPGAFRPPPRVESAFVGLELREPPLPPAERAGFQRLLRLGFAHKRKTLRNALSQGIGRDAADELLSRAGLGPRVRAEELPLATWLQLHQIGFPL